jgi:hypothetical protein
MRLFCSAEQSRGRYNWYCVGEGSPFIFIRETGVVFRSSGQEYPRVFPSSQTAEYSLDEAALRISPQLLLAAVNVTVWFVGHTAIPNANHATRGLGAAK